MPLFDYSCDECGEKFEKFLKFNNEGAEISCIKCGSSKVTKTVSMSNFHLSGTGWAKDGYNG